MSTRVVAPVIRMTATNARIAETLATRALDSADQYVDKYLPGDAATENGDGKFGNGELLCSIQQPLGCGSIAREVSHRPILQYTVSNPVAYPVPVKPYNSEL